MYESLLKPKNSKKLLLILSATLFLAFLAFSYFVARNHLKQFDFDLTVKFQDKIPRRLDDNLSVFSILGSVEVSAVICMIILGFLLLKRYFKAFIALFLLPLALAMEYFGKGLINNPSPPYLFYRGTIDFNFPSHYVHSQYSYPSGHMLRSTFIVTFLLLYCYFRLPKKYQIFILPVAAFYLIIMFISRIYLGEHWFTDVVGGLLLGSSFGILAGIFIPIKKSRTTNIEKNQIKPEISS